MFDRSMWDFSMSRSQSDHSNVAMCRSICVAFRRVGVFTCSWYSRLLAVPPNFASVFTVFFLKKIFRVSNEAQVQSQYKSTKAVHTTLLQVFPAPVAGKTKFQKLYYIFPVALRRKPPAPSVMDSGSLICWRMFGHIERFLALIGHFLAPYGAILAPYEGMLAPFEAMLAPCEPILGSCWAYVGSILTHFWLILAQIKNFDPF